MPSGRKTKAQKKRRADARDNFNTAMASAFAAAFWKGTKVQAFLFDTETTGLIGNHKLPLDKQPSVVEFYGCLADLATGEVIEEFETLVKPPKAIPEETIKIHHITDAMVEQSPPFAAIAETVKLHIERAPVVIAHNLSFDVEMIDLEMERLSTPIVWPRKLCTVEQTIHLRRHRLKQSQLYQMLFNETFEGAHRAKADVLALLRICVELHKRRII
jgi:DNA polymerase-3 subunit epsilon